MKQQAVQINSILNALDELMNDATVPKNVKEKIEVATKALKEKDCDISVKKDKAIQELDEISDETNLQPYTRTQVWNILSMLEKI